MYMLGDLQRQLGRWTPLSFGIIHVWDRYSVLIESNLSSYLSKFHQNISLFIIEATNESISFLVI